MATTITITCPECEKELKAPSTVVGKKIRCKSCGATFEAEAPRGAKPPAKGAKAPAKAPAKGGKAGKGHRPDLKDDDGDGKPYEVTDMSFAPRCPNCANEMEDEEAVICLFCGYNTVTRTRSEMRKVRDVTGMDMFLWLLPGIACALVVIGLITFCIVYCLKIEDWVDTSDSGPWYGFVGSLGVKIWLCVCSIWVAWKAGKFAFKRLVINNTPPEIIENLWGAK